MSAFALALPGKEVSPSASKHHAGPGTYISDDGRILASLVGTPRNTRLRSIGNPTVGLPFKSTLALVDTPSSDSQASQQRTLILPGVGDCVYARVLRMTQREVIFNILVIDRGISDGNDINNTTDTDSDMFVLPHPFRGVLRSIDVRATQKDTVVLADSFRVGDIVRARVISLGDQGGYYLTTAGNEFGVVMAWSDAGFACVPISWKEVQDEVTGGVEGRKVAKPI